MKELQKQKLEGSGGVKPRGGRAVLCGKLLKPKTRLVKGTKFVSFLFIAASILISAGIMQAANVYYDLDTSKIMMGDNVNATAGLSVTTSNLDVGSGNFIVAPASGDMTTKGKIGLEETGAGNFKTYFQSGDQTVFGGDITYTLPINDGTGGQVLSTDGNGVLSWTATGSVVTVGSMTGTHVFDDATATGDWFGMGAAAGRIAFDDQATDYVNILSANVGIGVATPSAALHLKAGTATAGTAPLKFTAGTNLTTPETGALEFNGDNLFITDDAGTPERFKIADIDQDLMTSGRLCQYTASGHLDCTIDSASVGHTAVTIGTFSETGDAKGLSLSTQEITLHAATVSEPGAVSISAQTFNGLKTFDDGATSTGTLTASNALTSVGATTLGTGAVSAGAWDATTLSLDATDNSNLSVTGSAKTLTLAATGGSTNQVIVNSAGTGSDAIDINATGTGGGLDIDTTDGAIALTAGGATNGNINLVAGHDFSLTGAANSVFGIATSNVAQFVNIGTGTAVDTINIGTGGTGIDVIRIGDSLADLALTDTQWSISNLGVASFASAAFGGGYGDTGSTFDTDGNIQANGNVTANGTLTLGLASTTSGDITLYNSGSAFWQKIATSAAGSNQTYTLPATGGTFAMTTDVTSIGTGVLRGQVNIFGFDYPTQCSTSCDAGTYATISRDIITLPNFPAVLTGKTRSYKLAVRYADDLTVDGNTTVQIWNTTTNALADSFTIAGLAADGDVEKGKVILSDDLTIPLLGDDWEVRVGVPAVGDVIRIYSLELAAYDVD